jgi:hypothetical protein
VIKFHDKFARQLELKIRDQHKADEKGQPPPLERQSYVPPEVDGLSGSTKG